VEELICRLPHSPTLNSPTILSVFRTMTPRRARSARSAAPTIGEVPFASRDVGIIAKTPRENQARRNEIMVRTKSRRICRVKAGATEMRPY